MHTQVVIDARFNGPPGSANGGYACGAVARYIEGPAEITLRAPPPLDTPMAIGRGDGRRVQLWHGETLVAEGRPVELTLEVPPPPTHAQAEEAAARGLEARDGTDASFGTCFVCGPRRAPGDGLRVFPGSVDGRGIVACPWGPDPSLGDDGGFVRPGFIWSALDCPTAFAMQHLVGRPDTRPGSMLLGRMTTRITAPVAVDERCIVIGWPIGAEGRKQYGGSALFVSGACVAAATATWITPEASPPA